MIITVIIVIIINYHHHHTANYPEFLGKCHMINAPWLFTTFWFFVKGFLDER